MTIGAGPDSPEESITTPEDGMLLYTIITRMYTLPSLPPVPSGPPQEVSGVPLSATSIQIAWQPPLPEERNGVIREYNIKVIDVESGQVLRFRKDGSDTMLTLTSLHPFYTYQCSISAVTIGNGPPAYVEVITHEQGVTQHIKFYYC